MYMLGQYVIDKYSGMSYPEFVKKRIFDPLGMTSTTFSTREAYESGRFSQFWADSNGRRIPPWIRDEHISLLAGAGGIISDVGDMVRDLAYEGCRC